MLSVVSSVSVSPKLGGCLEVARGQNAIDGVRRFHLPETSPLRACQAALVLGPFAQEVNEPDRAAVLDYVAPHIRNHGDVLLELTGAPGPTPGVGYAEKVTGGNKTSPRQSAPVSCFVWHLE